jgi:excisionase family DNA binding protein
MTIVLDGQTFYTTAEACKLAGTNRDTLLRWIREKKFNDVEYRDRNGWRLFTEEDVIRLKKRVNRIIEVNVSLEKTR